ncbi:helix-turn-helix transcriptional regulator [Azonexus sp.]|jgi:AraC-like DNA-binding protein|uniref:AraC family transcriptional regulator n=1 Tax=Azonexus sp. TaxID=1872668 RepID=UPI0028288BEF|nr:helix-turn-helix transcriptional regulator [Azonexus sp.]MDR1995209.1 helix-turn-helix transcriptional regulator [Azonexus sp.]
MPADPADIAFIRDADRPILTHGRALAAGQAIRAHSHPRGQLLWAIRGVLQVVCQSGVWVVPPSHAVWIPGDMPHQVVFEVDSEMLNLYVDPSIAVRTRHGEDCAVLVLTPLARELIRRIGALLGEMGAAASFDNRLRRLCGVILDELEHLTEAKFNLPGGQDARLMRVTRHLVKHPDDRQSLTELAELAAASTRTLERLFRNETGQSFRQWRSRLRLLSAIEKLNLGQSSTAIAASLGYRSPSAFVAAFREQFGTSPQRLLRME